jgi:hypothetical protein
VQVPDPVPHGAGIPLALMRRGMYRLMRGDGKTGLIRQLLDFLQGFFTQVLSNPIAVLLQPRPRDPALRILEERRVLGPEDVGLHR